MAFILHLFGANKPAHVRYMDPVRKAISDLRDLEQLSTNEDIKALAHFSADDLEYFIENDKSSNGGAL